jgi:uncharacterized membrane protein YphA (DoxX/SURF4 family)
MPEAWCNVDRPLLLTENEALRKPIEDLSVEAAGSSRRNKTHPRFPHTGGNIVYMTLNRATDYIMVFLRIALGIAFLSAVADRFGLWGTYGQPNVEWGDFSRFVDYTGQLNWFAPTAVIPALAWAATFAEILLGLALVLGFFTRVAALLSGLMLLVFALTMIFALGVKAPLNFSVFSSSAGAFLLAAFGKYPLSIDALKSPRESLAE